jgi:hypothetical protein
MNRARLSFGQLCRYITWLTDLDLLNYDEKNMLYTTTPRGMRYLKNFTELEGIAEAVDARKAVLNDLLYNEGARNSNPDSAHIRKGKGRVKTQIGKEARSA